MHRHLAQCKSPGQHTLALLSDRGQTFACGGFVARDIRLGAARRARMRNAAGQCCEIASIVTQRGMPARNNFAYRYLRGKVADRSNSALPAMPALERALPPSLRRMCVRIGTRDYKSTKNRFTNRLSFICVSSLNP
ncbi:hypothetical protein [Burkholderia ubonensis]|uniref:hypothetical protein n=1 Tax=Burkholderia ubonensis TaxID=101571 RepID=UPI0012FC7D38|nr:hypothetical protein [Burkholderia ubonensis]